MLRAHALFMVLFLAVLALPARPAAAQTHAFPAVACTDTLRLAATDLSTSDRDLGRILQTAGAMPAAPALMRRGSTERTRAICAGAAVGLEWALEPSLPASPGPALRLLPVTAALESNSQYRKDRNNGALRGGVGASSAITAGVEVAWKGFTLALAPQFINDANNDFTTIPVASGGRSVFSHPYHGSIDFPQRFGTDGESRIVPGQSYLRFGTRHFEVGVSTENVWLGAAQVYPIMLSSTAPGFPHAFAGTVEPIDLRILKIGAHAIWARVDESDFFDTNPENDHRLFAAAVIEASSPWIPGLHVGIARVSHEIIPPEGFPLEYWLGSVIDAGITFETGGNREDGNAIGALLARWVLPEAGFEAYGEWSREDTPLDLRDLIEEPDWTQAYALGFQQLVSLRHVRLRWYGELIHLGEAAPVRAGKGFFSYYTHSSAVQGHTHDGQILGAAPGPGSDAQIFGVDGFHRWGMSGLWLERTRYDEDTYYRRWARMYGESRHDVEIGIGARHMMPMGPLRVGGQLLYNNRANRSFLNLEDRTAGRLVETNVGLNLRAEWRPGVEWRF